MDFNWDILIWLLIPLFGLLGRKKKKKPASVPKQAPTTGPVLVEERITKAREIDSFDDSLEIGSVLNCTLFAENEVVDVTGVSKGRGFSGVMKRHGFHGGKKTHGSHSHRIPGSIGCSAWPAKVIKGKKLPGRYGNDTKTIQNLEILDIRPEENLILIKGLTPGAKKGLLKIKKKKF